MLWRKAMIKSWLVIGIVTLLIASLSGILRREDVKWFRQLKRPRWLTFEGLIPLIWTVVFICGGWSAYITWENTPDRSEAWGLMAFYGLVELVIVLYPPISLWFHNLKAGTIVGGLGFLLGLILAMVVFPVSPWATALLLPYLLWSPIGTYTTWVMSQLNA
jgi:tryptophan-rich sensory protein